MPHTPDLAVVVKEVQRSGSVSKAIEIVRDTYSLRNVTYHLVRHLSDGVDSPWVRTTYSPEWVGVYVVRQYVDIDPVIKAGISRVSPFEWASLYSEPGYNEVFTAAAEYGVGQNGFSVPIVDRKSRRALFSVSSEDPNPTWQAKLARFAPDWIEIAHSIHKMAVAEAFGTADPIPKLGPREIECLQWAARGKDAKDTATILGLSEHTIRSYLKSARFKLDCANISQAIGKAAKYNLIEA